VSRVTSRINGGCGIGGEGENVAVRNGASSLRSVSVSSSSMWNCAKSAQPGVGTYPFICAFDGGATLISRCHVYSRLDYDLCGLGEEVLQRQN
jgi:hypothetical protein